VDQAQKYVDLLNGPIQNPEDLWELGWYLPPMSFQYGIFDASAWWQEAGLIVYESKLNRQRALKPVVDFCTALASLKLLEDLLNRLPKPDPWIPPLPVPGPVVVPMLDY
jgi:hypothetical protein